MKKILLLPLLSIVVLTLGGCFAGKSGPRYRYLFNIPQAAQGVRDFRYGLIEVRHTKAVPQFASNEFLYRLNSVRYLPDYYHIFLVPVTSQITQITEAYLSNKGYGLYVSDVSDDAKKHPSYVLSSVLEKLYADYRNSAKPQAVVSIRYMLVDVREPKKRFMMNKVYTESVPLSTKTASALFDAWQTGIYRIMYRLNRRLNGILSD